MNIADEKKRVEIFCCYARKDQSLLLKLRTHLALLEREGFLNIWHDTDISPGTEWEKEINKHLNTAHIILLLISPDFMTSEYCYSKEMKRAMERHEAGEARVIPILLRPGIWREAPFAKLQMLPSNARAVTEWRNRDKVFSAIVQGIEQVAREQFTKLSIAQSPNTTNTTRLYSIEDSRSELFSFGPIETTWRVVDGDGEHEYTSEMIRTHFDPRIVVLPQDLAERKSQIQQQEERKHQEGQSFWWNGERYCLDKFIISRTGLEEYLTLELWFKPSDYYTFLATNMSLDDASLREKYVQDANWLAPIPFFGNSFGISLIVVTQDEYTILTQRSPFVGERPEEYNISMNEGLSKSLDRSTRGHAPDVYRCASRGLTEELGLFEPHEFNSANILFLSFGVDTRYVQWGLLGMVKVDITAAEVLQRRARGVKDKWENTTFHAVEFDPDVLVPFVLSKDRWLPNALACIYHALVHEFGTHRVEHAIRKYRN